MTDLTPVESSHIAGVGRDGDDLLVEFRSGDRWRYKGGGSKYEGMVSARSAGTYFHREVKGKHEGLPE
jgi:hypothetical protein